MKRILLILSSLALMTSCVVNTSSNLKRTPYYLSAFVQNQYESTVGSCLTLLASGTFKKDEIIGDQISVTFTSVADNAVHVEGKGNDVDFSFDALLLPGSYDRNAYVLSNLSFLYDEKNGYQLEMHYDGQMSYDWKETYSVTYISYSLEPSGVLLSEFYMNGAPVDYCKLVYNFGAVSFSTSVKE